MHPHETEILDGFPVGCLVASPERTIRHANAYLRDLLGRPATEVAGNSLCRFLSGGSVVMLESYLEPLLARYGRFDEILLRVVDASGNPVPVIVNAWLVEDSGDTHWTFVSAVERERLYQELVSARRSLEERAAELAHRAATDILTGLFNRAEFDRHAELMIARAKRAGQPITLMFVDIDWFKLVNDRLGHPAGDEILQSMGPLLRNVVRSGDLVARYGGEEFALMLDNAGHPDSEAAAARVNEAVRGLDAGGFGITVSIGIATGLAGEELCFEDLYGLADAALYDAKRQGRDRTVSASISGRS